MYNFEKMFTYMKSDPDWVKKFLIGSFLSFIPVAFNFMLNFMPDADKNPQLAMKMMPFFLLFGLLAMIFTLPLSGYYMKIINDKIHKTTDNLPLWSNFKEFILIGLKSFVGCLFYILAASVIFIILIVSAFLLKSISPWLIIIPVLLMIILLFGAIILLSLLNLSYFYDFKISSYFNYKRVGIILKNNIVNYFIFLVIIMAVTTMINIGSTILGYTIVGIFAVPFLIFYSYLVMADVSAQFLENTELVKNENTETIETTADNNEGEQN